MIILTTNSQDKTIKVCDIAVTLPYSDFLVCTSLRFALQHRTSSCDVASAYSRNATKVTESIHTEVLSVLAQRPPLLYIPTLLPSFFLFLNSILPKQGLELYTDSSPCTYRLLLYIYLYTPAPIEDTHTMPSTRIHRSSLHSSIRSSDLVRLCHSRCLPPLQEQDCCSYHEPRCERADNHHPQVSEFPTFNGSSLKITKSDTDTPQQAEFSQPSDGCPFHDLLVHD